MNVRVLLERFLLGLCFVMSLSCCATNLQELQTAEAVEKILEQEFKQCTDAVIAVKQEGNQLLSAGTTSCHEQMAQQWLERHNLAKAAIEQRFGHQCAAMVSAIDTQVDAYAQKVDGFEVLGQMPLDTNYDVAHLIAKHRYNLFYYLATGVSCG